MFGRRLSGCAELCLETPSTTEHSSQPFLLSARCCEACQHLFSSNKFHGILHRREERKLSRRQSRPITRYFITLSTLYTPTGLVASDRICQSVRGEIRVIFISPPDLVAIGINVITTSTIAGSCFTRLHGYSGCLIEHR